MYFNWIQSDAAAGADARCGLGLTYQIIIFLRINLTDCYEKKVHKLTYFSCDLTNHARPCSVLIERTVLSIQRLLDLVTWEFNSLEQ